MNYLIIKNSSLEKLPYDIQEYIFNFIYNDAAIIIQNIVKIMIKNRVNFIYNIMKYINRCFELDIKIEQDKFYYKNKIITKKDAFTTVSNCNCCKRHSINKPKIISTFNETDFNLNKSYNITCKCPCRHLARWFCR